MLFPLSFDWPKDCQTSAANNCVRISVCSCALQHMGFGVSIERSISCAQLHLQYAGSPTHLRQIISAISAHLSNDKTKLVLQNIVICQCLTDQYLKINLATTGKSGYVAQLHPILFACEWLLVTLWPLTIWLQGPRMYLVVNITSDQS